MQSNSHITRKEIASMLGMTLDGARYHIDKMKDAGIITYAGTSRKGHWEILKELSD